MNNGNVTLRPEKIKINIEQHNWIGDTVAVTDLHALLRCEISKSFILNKLILLRQEMQNTLF